MATTVKVKKKSSPTRTKPGQAQLSWAMKIATKDGTRAANLSGGKLALPANTFADVSGLEECPLEKLQANDNKSCSDDSIVGKSTGDIYSSPIREEVYKATGILYFTGMKRKTPTFASYFTLIEIPSAHSITTLTVKKGRSGSTLSFAMPKIPTAPGPPDATPTDVSFSFDRRGPKGYLFRQSKACKDVELDTTYTFYGAPKVNDSSEAC